MGRCENASRQTSFIRENPFRPFPLGEGHGTTRSRIKHTRNLFRKHPYYSHDFFVSFFTVLGRGGIFGVETPLVSYILQHYTKSLPLGLAGGLMVIAGRTVTGYNDSGWVCLDGHVFRHWTPLDIQVKGGLNMGMEILLIGALFVGGSIIIIGFVAGRQADKLRRKLGKDRY